jgi:hypothetical protein
MSIAIHSSTGTGHAPAVAALSRRHEAARDSTAPERSADGKAPKGRHALMNALSDALAGLGADAGVTAGTGAASSADTSAVRTPEQKEALHAFAHELFSALRPTPDATGKGHHGRGFAWGRTSLGDLAERIEALAQRLAGAATPAGGTAPAALAAGDGATPAPGSTGAASTAAGSTGTTLDAAAQPATGATGSTGTTGTTTAQTAGAATAAPTVTTRTPTASAAPATGGESPLLAAFRRLAASLQGSAPDAGTAAASPADALAALLHRMAQALVPDGRTEPPASGSLIDVTA